MVTNKAKAQVVKFSGLVAAEMTGKVFARLVIPQDVTPEVVWPGGLVVTVLAGDGVVYGTVDTAHHLHVQRELLGRLIVAENILIIQIYCNIYPSI